MLLVHRVALLFAQDIFHNLGFKSGGKIGEVLSNGIAPDGRFTPSNTTKHKYIKNPVFFEFETKGGKRENKTQKADDLNSYLVYVEGGGYSDNMSLKDFYNKLWTDIRMQLDIINDTIKNGYAKRNMEKRKEWRKNHELQ